MKTIIALLWLASSSTAAWAATVFNNFGPGDTYFTSGGAGIGRPFPPTQDYAEAFQVGAQHVMLDGIEIAVSFSSGTPPFDLVLTRDNGGSPGDTLEIFHVPPSLHSLGQANPPLALASVLHPQLSAGTRYWLYATTNGELVEFAWNSSLIEYDGLSASREGNAAWVPYSDRFHSAFRVSGTVIVASIPEPDLPLILLAGLATLGTYRHVKRRRTS